jgi:hypothetical protein
MKIAIIGSHTITHYETLQTLLLGVAATEVISGGATGVDQLAERWAKENGKLLRVIRPAYAQHGKQAPLLRNLQIMEAAETVYILWDGNSRGTKQAMDYAHKLGKPVVCKVVPHEKQLSLF